MAQKAPDDMRPKPKEGHADRLSNNVAQIMKPALKVGGVIGMSNVNPFKNPPFFLPRLLRHGPFLRGIKTPLQMASC